MHKKLSKVLVTGGAGFIGSAFVRLLVERGYHVAVVDSLTYAGDMARLRDIKNRIAFYRADIGDVSSINRIVRRLKPRAVVHFAAETHVDRSIRHAGVFLTTNVVGTQILMEACRTTGVEKFVHISTDEVYGEIKKGYFTEESAFSPNSPYAASKAAADMLVKSYIRTHKFPAVIVRPSNNYGPWQYPEKLVPVVILKALHNQPVPVYARGLNMREWLYVTDCAEGVLKVMEKGKIGEAYNIGSAQERRNIDTVKKILDLLGKSHSLIEFVQDRPGHDIRYALDFSKIQKLGWKPRVNFDTGMTKVVSWSLNHQEWLESKLKDLKSHWQEVYRKK